MKEFDFYEGALKMQESLTTTLNTLTISQVETDSRYKSLDCLLDEYWNRLQTYCEVIVCKKEL